MEGVVPRRRDCLGESRVLEGGRSMSPRGGGEEGEEEGGSRGDTWEGRGCGVHVFQIPSDP